MMSIYTGHKASTMCPFQGSIHSLLCQTLLSSIVQFSFSLSLTIQLLDIFLLYIPNTAISTLTKWIVISAAQNSAHWDDFYYPLIYWEGH